MTLNVYAAACFATLAGLLALGSAEFGRATAQAPQPDLAALNAVSKVSSHATSAASLYDAFAKEPKVLSVARQPDGSYVVTFRFALKGYGPVRTYRSTVTPLGIALPAVQVSR